MGAIINNDYYCCCTTIFLNLSIRERKFTTIIKLNRPLDLVSTDVVGIVVVVVAATAASVNIIVGSGYFTAATINWFII